MLGKEGFHLVIGTRNDQSLKPHSISAQVPPTPDSPCELRRGSQACLEHPLVDLTGITGRTSSKGPLGVAWTSQPVAVEWTVSPGLARDEAGPPTRQGTPRNPGPSAALFSLHRFARR